MNLYISSDMEGIAGVTSWHQVDARTPHPEYAAYRRYYTQEVCAAIRGARSAGCADVLVNDSHGPMHNLLFDELPADVRVIFGNRKPHAMVQNADGGFDGAFFIGYHGAVGDADAVLCHTYSPAIIHDVRVNGERCSEATLNAGLLGYFGVPLLMVSGDRTTVEGIQKQMPWVRGAVVKESIGAFAANTLSPAAARSLIETIAREAVTRAGEAKPYVFEPPVVLDVELVTAAQADVAATIPGFERTGGRSVRFAHEHYPVVFRAFVATWRFGAYVT